MDTILECIEISLAAADGVESAIHAPFRRGLECPDVQQRIEWIERQLATLVSKLQGMQADLNAGLSIEEMGFTDPEELQDFLQDLTSQIAQLKSLAQAISKGIGRGV
ncbi:hypothetical protein [Comamonas testosteroni]|jgi:flagellar biosynthesis chaperone FliJ|uniref:hypothetical protein n=1 Tax=Comamonas testosteroni TaxID=285 RepID=UPI0026EFDF50|nr:hypothetical protein [Comamonas testosteroni]